MDAHLSQELNNKFTISLGDLRTDIEQYKWEATRKGIGSFPSSASAVNELQSIDLPAATLPTSCQLSLRPASSFSSARHCFLARSRRLHHLPSCCHPWALLDRLPAVPQDRSGQAEGQVAEPAGSGRRTKARRPKAGARFWEG